MHNGILLLGPAGFAELGCRSIALRTALALEAGVDGRLPYGIKYAIHRLERHNVALFLALLIIALALAQASR